MHRILVAAVMTLSCASALAQAEDMQKMGEESRKVAGELLLQVRGELLRELEHAEIVSEPAGRFYRFMKANPLGPQCLTCHGPSEKMSAAQRAQLANEYPFDRATGFVSGQVRGATSVKRPT